MPQQHILQICCQLSQLMVLWRLNIFVLNPHKKYKDFIYLFLILSTFNLIHDRTWSEWWRPVRLFSWLIFFLILLLMNFTKTSSLLWYSESWDWRLQYGCCNSFIFCNLFCHGKVWKWPPLHSQLKSSYWTKWMASGIKVYTDIIVQSTFGYLCSWSAR